MRNFIFHEVSVQGNGSFMTAWLIRAATFVEARCELQKQFGGEGKLIGYNSSIEVDDNGKHIATIQSSSKD